MTKEEFDKKFPEIIIKVTGIHDKETLHKFMLEKINTELDIDMRGSQQVALSGSINRWTLQLNDLNKIREKK
jgi:hypothetical protein